MRIAFVGGNGHHYLRGFITDPAGHDVHVGACGDGFDDPAAIRWAKANQIRWYDTFDDLCKELKPDVVSVGAVYGKNGVWVAKALERNMPVVSDKPVAATWEQLDRIRDLTGKTGLNVITEFDMRCRADFRAARNAVVSGQVGKVLLVTAQKSYRFGSRPTWYADRDLYGGTLLWIASHGIDAIQYVSGVTMTHVTGHHGNVSQPQLGSFEDQIALVYQTSSGATAVAHADLARPAAATTHGDDRIRVVGSEGVIELRGARTYLTTHTSPETDITETMKPLKAHEEMWKAVSNASCDLYSTQQSLQTAHLLLKSRDASDKREWMEI